MLLSLLTHVRRSFQRRSTESSRAMYNRGSWAGINVECAVAATVGWRLVGLKQFLDSGFRCASVMVEICDAP